jgi:hypothetical protein
MKSIAQCFDPVTVGSGYPNQRNPGTRQRICKKAITAPTFRTVVRTIVKFYDRKDGGAFRIIEHKIDMFLRQCSTERLIPQRVGAMQNIGQPGFERQAATRRKRSVQDAIEVQFSLGKKSGFGQICPWCRGELRTARMDSPPSCSWRTLSRRFFVHKLPERRPGGGECF